MLQLGLRRSLGLGATARRFATAPLKTSAQPAVLGTQLRSLLQPRLIKCHELVRPLSTVSSLMVPRAPWAAGASICPKPALQNSMQQLMAPTASPVPVSTPLSEAAATESVESV